MKIAVRLLKEDSDSTLSEVLIDGVKSFFSIEDEERLVKVKGETRVDAGTYPLALRDSQKFSSSYLVNPNGSFQIISAKNATEIQKSTWLPHKLIWVKNTPRHEFILMHWGNTDDDTDGCLIIGEAIGFIKGQQAVLLSRTCYEKWYPILAKEISIGNSLIEYIRDKPMPVA